MVYDRQDASYDFTSFDRGRANRLVLHVELPHYPITRGFIGRMTRELVGAERGQGWHAIAVHVRYDRRETFPAFAIIEWAPGGDWSEAHTGNPDTWSGYEYRAEFKPKVTNPFECFPPSEQAFTFAFEFNQALDRGETDEDTIIADIARRHGTTTQAVEEGINAVDQWSLC